LAQWPIFAVTLAFLVAACGRSDDADERYGPAFKSTVTIYGYAQSGLNFLNECLLLDPDRSFIYVEEIKRHQIQAMPLVRRVRTIWATEVQRNREPSEEVLRLMSAPIGADSRDLAMKDPAAFLATCRDPSSADNVSMTALRKLYPREMHDIDTWK
jgi:hypothetical protein